MAEPTQKNLLLHPRTARLVEQFTLSPSQALLITGPAGSGKSSLARNVSSALLGASESQLENHPSYTLTALPEKQSEISIDAIRQVRKSLSLKSSTAKSRRVIMIDGAHQMSHEAQSALLKILEEPPERTHFVLTASSANDLLLTVTSRTQELPVYPVSKEMAQKYYSNQSDDRTVESAWRLSAGSAGLLGAILADDRKHPLRLAVEDAKKFLAASTYERLLQLDEISDKRESLSLFLDGLSRTLGALSDNAVNGESKRVASILRSRKLVNRLSEQLDGKANTRLVGLELVLRLKV